jgi:hypothetical protein
MKRTGLCHMGHSDGKYKLRKRIVVTATGWRRKVPLLRMLHLPPISPAWPPATGSALDMLRSLRSCSGRPGRDKAQTVA